MHLYASSRQISYGFPKLIGYSRLTSRCTRRPRRILLFLDPACKYLFHLLESRIPFPVNGMWDAMPSTNSATCTKQGGTIFLVSKNQPCQKQFSTSKRVCRGWLANNFNRHVGWTPDKKWLNSLQGPDVIMETSKVSFKLKLKWSPKVKCESSNRKWNAVEV